MDAEHKELAARKDEIMKELELLFKTNMKISDWDIPEANDKEVAELLLEILQEGLVKIKQDVASGKYTNY